jgi:uncharacterized protein (TIGR00156 family)
MKLTRIVLMIGLATSFSTAALAVNEPAANQPAPAPTADQPQATPINAAKSLPDGSEVTISGTVENFDSRHPFTLRDSSGAINVDLSDIKPIVLHNGEKVTITGDVDKGFLSTNVAATDVHL